MHTQILKYFLLVSFSVFSMFSCKKAETMDIFICIGQSNMAGRAEVPEEENFALEKVFILNDKDEWEKAANPMNKYSTVRKNMSMQRLGPSWSFAKKMSNEFPEKRFGLVVNAKGGSTIEEWEKGSYFYNECVIRALKAQKSGNIKAILWHQGEGNQKNPGEYAGKFDSLVYNLRKDLGLPDLPVVVGEIGKWRDSAREINAVLRSLPLQVSNVGVALADDLEHKGDNSHFDTASQLQLGERYASKVIELAYK